MKEAQQEIGVWLLRKREKERVMDRVRDCWGRERKVNRLELGTNHLSVDGSRPAEMTQQEIKTAADTQKTGEGINCLPTLGCNFDGNICSLSFLLPYYCSGTKNLFPLFPGIRRKRLSGGSKPSDHHYPRQKQQQPNNSVVLPHPLPMCEDNYSSEEELKEINRGETAVARPRRRKSLFKENNDLEEEEDEEDIEKTEKETNKIDEAKVRGSSSRSNASSGGSLAPEKRKWSEMSQDEVRATNEGFVEQNALVNNVLPISACQFDCFVLRLVRVPTPGWIQRQQRR